jgi:flagella basal body P-ring formation protein FlgA
MRHTALALALATSLAAPVPAETLVAAATIRARTILGPEHLVVVPDPVPGAFSDPVEAIGQEARVVLYAGRPIRPGDVGPPALVDRNQVVPLIYLHGRIAIETEGRALDRAAEGEAVRVLNLTSRATVTGVLDAAGRVHVGAPGTGGR